MIVFSRNVADDKDLLIKSRSELFDGFFISDIVAKVLRERLSAKYKQDMQNKVTVDSFKYSTDLPDDKPYLSKYKNFYEVTLKVDGKWQNLSFTVVEEAGVMRIAFVSMIDD